MPARLALVAGVVVTLLLGFDGAGAVPVGYRHLSGVAPGGRVRMRSLRDALPPDERCGTLLVAADGSLHADTRPCEAEEDALQRHGRSLLQSGTDQAIPLAAEDAGADPSCVGCIPGSRVPVNDSTQLPYLAMGRLLGRVQGQSVGLQCTGTLVGRRHLITAAHCVFDITDTRLFVASLTFAQAQNASTQPFGTVNWLYARIPATFAQQEDYTVVAMNFDYALVTLASDAPAPVLFNLTPPAPIGRGRREALVTAGYPQEEAGGSLWRATCADALLPYSTQNSPPFANVSACAYDACTNLFRHTCVATTGQSGSTMWAISQNALALLISKVSADGGGYLNLGLVLSDFVLTSIRNWYNEDGLDAAGPLPSFARLPPPPSLPPAAAAAGGSAGAWRAAALALAGVLGAACLASVAAAAALRWRSARGEAVAWGVKPGLPVQQEPAEAAAAAGIVDTHTQLLESGTFAVENGAMRPVWEEAGVLDFTSGDRFAGELRKKRPSGYGIGQYRRPRGAVFAGQWLRGRQHGWGVVSREGQGRVAGRWVEGRPVVAMAQGVDGEYSVELEDERAEVLDACAEAVRMAQAAADSAAACGLRHAVHGALHRATG